MLKALVRTGIAVGFVYGVYSVAQKFWGPQIDAALDRVTKGAKDAGSNLASQVTAKVSANGNSDFGSKDKHLTASLEDVSSSKKAV